MAISDSQFRLGVGVVGFLLVAGIGSTRFFGSVGLPAKPTPPTPSGTSKQLLSNSAATVGVYEELLSRDAVAAGVRAPSGEEMSRKFTYQVDAARHVLEVGQPATSLAGLELRALRSSDSVVLEIKNTTTAHLAYNVTAQAIPNTSCNSVHPVQLNVMTIAAGATVVRTECVWRANIAVVITKAETIELPPLAIYYIDQLPPALIGLPPNVARSHRRVETKEPCSAIHSSVVRSGLESGDIGWRDLVDFYARHRCQTYQFSPSYRAFTKDGQHAMPFDGSGK